MSSELFTRQNQKSLNQRVITNHVLEQFRLYSIAIFSTFTATWLRIELEPLIEGRVPFGLFFVSSMLTAWLAGTGPAILAAILSLFSAAHFIIPPHDSLLLEQPSDLLALGIYLVVTLASILLFHNSAFHQRLAEESAQENARLNEGLREADRRKDEFLALLAHELRNPLTPIQTAINLLEIQQQEELPQHPAFQTIRRQLGQLVRLVNDLLDASRYVHGKLEIKSELFRLEDAVQIAIESNNAVFEERNHRFIISLSEEQILIRGDLIRMAQVISNLLHNAAKYTPQGGYIRLNVGTSENFAEICVEDDGVGIPGDLRNRIFELFTQVNPSRNRKEGGLGIGLALVRELVQLHSGTISVKSEGAGQGSSFTIRIPCTLQQQSLEEKVADSASSIKGTQHDELRQCPRKTKILMIDDNVDSTDMLEMLLEIEGYQTRSANEGFLGIQIALDFHPDVILLDLGLPGMDGYEVARTLRSKSVFHETVIIAVSGWDGQEYRVLSQRAGIDDHVAKPFQPAELLHIIEDNLILKSQ